MRSWCLTISKKLTERHDAGLPEAHLGVPYQLRAEGGAVNGGSVQAGEHGGVGLRGWLAAPVFESEELTERAHSLWVIAWGCLIVGCPLLIVLLLGQPESVYHRLSTIGALLAMVPLLHEINRRGYTRVASWGLILGLIAVVTHRAWYLGGIRGPIMPFYVVFVMMTGLLLGRRGTAISSLKTFVSAVSQSGSTS